MVRWIRVILLIGCLAVQIAAQVPKEQGSVGQATGAEQSSGVQTAAAPTESAEYPLDAFKDFSAIMVGSRMEIGAATSSTYIYRSGNMMRVEGPEGHGYFLTDLSTLETYGISSEPCVHDTHPYLRASPFPAKRQGSTVKRVPVGKETVDGHSCQVEEVTISGQRPGAPPLKMKFWEADDLQGFPIKIEFPYPGGKSATIKYKNVVLGPQDPTLFIHPKSCEALPPKPRPKKPEAPPPAKKAPAGDSHQ